MLLNLIHHLGLDAAGIQSVPGGDINQAYKVWRKGRAYFLKLNRAAPFAAMMEKEARGLEALRTNSRFIVPQVEAVGVWEGYQYLLLEWLEPTSPHPDFWKMFGEFLAELHQKEWERYGWTEDNYIGRLPQSNNQHTGWGSFFTEERIRPLVKRLVDEGALQAALLDRVDRLANLFPDENPALLHGDLWSGNLFCAGRTGATANHPQGLPALIDPAIYIGHREMDIGMTQLFGGFDRSFLEAYHYHYPLAADWRERLPITQLYPLLVHALLFGGHYISSTASILQRY